MSHLKASFTTEPVLGTSLFCIAEGVDERPTDELFGWIVAECLRYERLLSAFDANSQFARWVSGEVHDDELDPIVVDMLARSVYWFEFTDGLVHPLAGRFNQLWAAASESGRSPDQDQLDRAVDSVRSLPFEIISGGADGNQPTDNPADNPAVRTVGDLTGLRLDAFAKGRIVDLVTAAAHERFGLGSLTVSIGGDMRSIGNEGVVVGLEHPDRPYDNATPWARVRVVNAGLATSSGSRRYEQVGGTKHSHLIDPGTGRSATGLASATVRASTAEEADALATALSVSSLSVSSLSVSSLSVDGVVDPFGLAARYDVELWAVYDDGSTARTT